MRVYLLLYVAHARRAIFRSLLRVRDLIAAFYLHVHSLGDGDLIYAHRCFNVHHELECTPATKGMLNKLIHEFSNQSELSRWKIVEIFNFENILLWQDS